jgi:hypothetical protein
VSPPPAGSWAAGFDLGLSDPFGSEGFDTEVLLGGFVEYYQTETVAWRGSLSYLDLGGPSGAGDAQLLMLNANGVYRWPVGGTVRPYVTGGLGLYRYDREQGDDGVEVGMDLGGGVEFHLRGSKESRRRIAVRAESLLHGTGGDEPDSFLQASVAVKFFW